LKEVENIGQNYDLEGLSPLYSCTIGMRVISMEVGLVDLEATRRKIVNESEIKGGCVDEKIEGEKN